MQVLEAPVPDNIQWNNVYITAKEKFLRKLISFVLTLILLIGCKLNFYKVLLLLVIY